MSKFLYGASIQGIQEFIFKTNKLQEIVGASEIVKKLNEDFEKLYKNSDTEILLNAAGNVKAIFHNSKTLQEHILNYERTIMKQAYGITVSQAVVKMDGEFQKLDKAINELERRLKIQRNKPAIPLDLALGIHKLNPQTGRPLTSNSEDMATKQKKEANAAFYSKHPEIKELKNISALSNGKNKIAIIHIDGNGLGQIVPKIGTNLQSFSQKLDTATKDAFTTAKQGKKVREVILGGDDVTAIVNANDALAFTEEFLQNFEKNTAKIEEIQQITPNLTACAGIAFVNKKYPFHYAVGLSEVLCEEAKNASGRNHSCLMFHNIQSSNFQSWKQFVNEELTIFSPEKKADGSYMQKIIRLDFGPYYLNKQDQPLIRDLINSIEAYRCEGSPISRLREWLSELAKSSISAQNLLDRINEITLSSGKWSCKAMQNNLQKLYKGLSNEKLIIEKDGCLKTPIYDIMQILSVTEANNG